MGIVKCFLNMVSDLRTGEADLTASPLDVLIASYDNYAYVGNRRQLRQVVLSLSSRLRCRIQRIPDVEHPSSDSDSDEHWAAWWYGRKDWDKNSGTFPDFVLACVGEEADYHWRGALLELKDSEGASIASFNSTLPSSVKDMQKLAPIVRDAVYRYDLPSSRASNYSWLRRCFYLVRTKAKSMEEVRVSLVEGTFFETLPTSELLREVWKQLLLEAGLPEQKTREVVESLGTLDREKIAISRHIDRASVKPRLRIMSEVESDGNPHTYREIPAGTVNLVIKPEVPEEESSEADWLLQSVDWFRQQAKAEGLTVQSANSQNVTFVFGEQEILLVVRCIHHRRNGRHLVLQYQL